MSTSPVSGATKKKKLCHVGLTSLRLLTPRPQKFEAVELMRRHLAPGNTFRGTTCLDWSKWRLGQSDFPQSRQYNYKGHQVLAEGKDLADDLSTGQRLYFQPGSSFRPAQKSSDKTPGGFLLTKTSRGRPCCAPRSAAAEGWARGSPGSVSTETCGGSSGCAPEPFLMSGATQQFMDVWVY